MSTARREGTAPMTNQPIRWTLAAIALSGMVAVPTAPAFADAGPVNVESIDIRGRGDIREVVVRTSKAPTFSVFRLAEPFRVLIDVNNGRMDDPIDLRKVDDGVIRYVATNQFTDEAASILRVEIALDETVPYSARAEGNSVVLTIGREKALPDGGPAAAPTPALDAPAASSGAAKSTLVLGKVQRRMKGKRALLRAPLKGKATASLTPRVEELSDPPRLVVDVDGASIRPKWQRVRVNRNGVKTARIADKGGSVRFVLDLARDAAAPTVKVSTKKGRLDLVISGAKVAKKKPESRPTLATAALAPQPTATADRRRADRRRADRRRADRCRTRRHRSGADARTGRGPRRPGRPKGPRPRRPLRAQRRLRSLDAGSLGREGPRAHGR